MIVHKNGSKDSDANHLLRTFLGSTLTPALRFTGANVSSPLRAPGAKDSGSVLWHLKDALEGFHQGCKTSECMGVGVEPRQWDSGLTLLLA